MNKIPPKCSIHSLDNPSVHSAHMDVMKALELAKKGDWGKNWELVEAYIIFDSIPQVLRRVARYTEDKGFEIIENDEEFVLFLSSMNVSIPESKVVDLLNTLI